ncbi:MAG: GNAT family N-acetyltransferase [Candidatus Merdivicinus sp.]
MIRKILTEKDMKEIYSLHMMRDFPDAERKPLQTVLTLMQRKIYHCFGWFDGQKLAAYACIVELPGLKTVLLDYFAVCPHGRGQGLGSMLLLEMTEYYAVQNLDVLLEAEHPAGAPDPEIAARRIAFYQRCGAVRASMDSIIFGVHYQILALGGQVSPNDLPAQLDACYRHLLTPDLYQKQVSFLPPAN